MMNLKITFSQDFLDRFDMIRKGESDVQEIRLMKAEIGALVWETLLDEIFMLLVSRSLDRRKSHIDYPNLV